MILIQGRGVSKSFGGLTALDHLDFEVHKGEILGLIGPNGSGKTTLFNVITGFCKPDKGRIEYRESDITGWRPDKVCRSGISRTFQLIRPFTSLNVFENVKVSAIFGRARAHKETINLEREIMDILNTVRLYEKRHNLIESLTIAELRHLELARALATKPDVLLLDEVLAGLTPLETEDLMEKIQHVKDSGITIFIIEHIMKAIMGLSDRIMVLNFGIKIADGDPKKIAKDKGVIEAYLGEEDVA